MVCAGGCVTAPVATTASMLVKVASLEGDPSLEVVSGVRIDTSPLIPTPNGAMKRKRKLLMLLKIPYEGLFQ